MHQHGGNRYQYQNIIDFSANTNLAGIPAGVAQAARDAITCSDCYPDPACTELVEAISGHEGVSSTNIICGNGAAELIFLLVRAIEPKKALLCVPSFYEYEKALRAVRCEIKFHFLQQENRFCITETFLEQITEETELVFLCNPNNPTGTLVERELLQKILIKCEKLGIVLILDECFLPFVREEALFSLKEVSPLFHSLFILKAFTKTYAMPGLRLGYGICSDQNLIHKMKEQNQPWSVSLPAQKAGPAALKETDYLEKSLRLLEIEKSFLEMELKELGMLIYGSEANYVFFFSDRSNLFEICIEKNILIRDCSNYLGLTKGYYRVQVRNRKENALLISALKG